MPLFTILKHFFIFIFEHFLSKLHKIHWKIKYFLTFKRKNKTSRIAEIFECWICKEPLCRSRNKAMSRIVSFLGSHKTKDHLFFRQNLFIFKLFYILPNMDFSNPCNLLKWYLFLFSAGIAYQITHCLITFSLSIPFLLIFSRKMTIFATLSWENLLISNFLFSP